MAPKCNPKKQRSGQQLPTTTTPITTPQSTTSPYANSSKSKEPLRFLMINEGCQNFTNTPALFGYWNVSGKNPDKLFFGLWSFACINLWRSSTFLRAISYILPMIVILIFAGGAIFVLRRRANIIIICIDFWVVKLLSSLVSSEYLQFFANTFTTFLAWAPQHHAIETLLREQLEPIRPTSAELSVSLVPTLSCLDSRLQVHAKLLFNQLSKLMSGHAQGLESQLAANHSDVAVGGVDGLPTAWGDRA